MDEVKTIHQKSRGEKVNVYIADFKGNKYLHIREWYEDKTAGEYKPSKTGIAIPLEKVDALREALDELVPKTGS